MAPFMKRFGGETYSLLRIMAGLLFLFHGSQKLLGYPKPPPEAPAFVIYLGGSIELVGGALIALGLFTRWAAFVSSGMMAAAYWMAHGTKHFHPHVNGGELAALYCFVFLFIAAHGSGMWSVDAARGASSDSA
jgi:putative oxidoreductase